MTRQLFAFFPALLVLAQFAAPAADAVEAPVHKAGLWEMKLVRTGSPIPEMTMQQCIDETVDKAMSTGFAEASNETCAKRDVQKTATGYVIDSVCSVAVISGTRISGTGHADITGDFNSAYTVKSTVYSDGGPSAPPRELTITIEAKWVGACKPDQKPGDIVMPGGYKMNVKDMEKLKGLAPK
jgi:hypothetical protein